ncbi:bile acid:sodium symporter family protein [Marinobacterium arenosum]|uniref:bile acid:sodium symporter family protein n=1 Tax=Marinobacterium arenosum TaxID=2862496 RepID=UPI001C9405F9|nr:bile acid:sodium symporter family protein [Marinobacterium arenosum]MBY4677802.1 bile acid:sodium symporter family protein [Marinobacterium arenosum]
MAANIISQLILPAALFFIMLGVGFSLQPADFRRVWQSPLAVAVGLTLQLLVLPVLGALVVLLFSLPPLMACGLMILTLTPGGATSNMITYLCRGDTALSVSLTALVSLITPFTLPLLTLWVLQWQLADGQVIDFPVLATMAKLVLIALLPVLLGMLVRYRWPVFCQRMVGPVKWLSLLFLLLVVVGILRANWDAFPALVKQLGPAVLSLVLLAMLIGYGVAQRLRLAGEQATCIAIEVGIQNAGTALLVTGGILQNPTMSASALIYGVLMNLPALALILYCNRPRRQRREAGRLG